MFNVMRWNLAGVTLELCINLLSPTILAKADLVGLGVQVPQVLIPQHPAIVEGIAVGAVVVAIGWVFPPTRIVTVVSLAAKVWAPVSVSPKESPSRRVTL